MPYTVVPGKFFDQVGELLGGFSSAVFPERRNTCADSCLKHYALRCCSCILSINDDLILVKGKGYRVVRGIGVTAFNKVRNDHADMPQPFIQAFWLAARFCPRFTRTRPSNFFGASPLNVASPILSRHASCSLMLMRMMVSSGVGSPSFAS